MAKRTFSGETTDAERIFINEGVLEGAKVLLGGNERLRECIGNFQASYADVPKDGRFEFLRDWFGPVGEQEGQEKAWSGEEETAERGNVKSNAQALTVWEWSESDAEAELWFFHREVARGRFLDFGGNGESSAAAVAAKGWEWTENDSEAEREEAERQLN